MKKVAYLQGQLQIYLRDLTESILSTLEEAVSAVSVGGSIALRDFHAGSSDIDVAIFLDSIPSESRLSALARELDHRALPCPCKGLDLVAYLEESVRASPPTPRAEFSFVTGKNWRTELAGRETNEGLLIDLFVFRNHGWSEYGTSPGDLIGIVEDDALHPLLASVVNWHRGRIHDLLHDPTGEFAVLNTCRAWRFLVTGIMGSKSAGGEWALARRNDLTVIDAALALRRGGHTDRLDKDEVLGCMNAIESEMNQ